MLGAAIVVSTIIVAFAFRYPQYPVMFPALERTIHSTIGLATTMLNVNQRWTHSAQQ